MDQDSKNKFFVTICREPPNLYQPWQTFANLRTAPSMTSRLQPRTIGYDRIALLLAYSQQLRQLGQESRAATARPDWARWKTAFKKHVFPPAATEVPAFDVLESEKKGLRILSR